MEKANPICVTYNSKGSLTLAAVDKNSKKSKILTLWVFFLIIFSIKIDYLICYTVLLDPENLSLSLKTIRPSGVLFTFLRTRNPHLRKCFGIAHDITGCRQRRENLWVKFVIIMQSWHQTLVGFKSPRYGELSNFCLVFPVWNWLQLPRWRQSVPIDRQPSAEKNQSQVIPVSKTLQLDSARDTSPEMSISQLAGNTTVWDFGKLKWI
jgi:hypothetical protein